MPGISSTASQLGVAAWALSERQIIWSLRLPSVEKQLAKSTS